MAGATLFSATQLELVLNMALGSWMTGTPEGDGTMGALKEPLQALVGACYLYLYQGRELEDSLAGYGAALTAATRAKEIESLTKAIGGLTKEITGARQKSKIMATAMVGAMALSLRRSNAIDETMYTYMTRYIPDPNDDSWGVLLGGWDPSDPRYLPTCDMKMA